MDIILQKVTQQAMNYAIRSGVAVTATYAIKQSSRLLLTAPKSKDRDELLELQQRLQNKIRIISPAIDMIELIAARGNTSLQSAVTLTKELRWEIQSLAQRLARAAAASEESAKKGWLGAQSSARTEVEMKLIVEDIRKLLEHLEDAVPLINLAITTSGASLSSTLPSTVSPSRLLQASTFLTAGDTEYANSPDEAVQVGPTFILSMYMLFGGHRRVQEEEDMREMTWKEVMHKARVKLRRVPFDSNSAHRPDQFSYQMMIVEDLDDERVHTFDHDYEKPGRFDDVKLAGIREIFPIYQVSKIFYADTGKVLNIGTDGELNNPFLLLKRDIHATAPWLRMHQDEFKDDADEPIMSIENPQKDSSADSKPDPWTLPRNLDPEWIAFEVFTESDDDSSEEDSDVDESSPAPEEQLTSIKNPTSPPRQPTRSESIDSNLAKLMPDLRVTPSASVTSATPSPNHAVLPATTSGLTTKPPPPWVNSIRTSLSLLEMLLRLTSLQQYSQQSHLSIDDEHLNFFLDESASTGGHDDVHRQRLRADARRRVGWDPYDESPVKRRGEEYQYQYQQNGYLDEGARSSPAGQIGGWSPDGLQTRSITAVTDSPSPMPSRDRKHVLRRQEERKSSPLRPQTRRSDEGIGTSPLSGLEE